MYLDRNLCRNYTSKTNPLTHNTQAIVKAIFHTKPNQTAPRLSSPLTPNPRILSEDKTDKANQYLATPSHASDICCNLFSKHYKIHHLILPSSAPLCFMCPNLLRLPVPIRLNFPITKLTGSTTNIFLTSDFYLLLNWLVPLQTIFWALHICLTLTTEQFSLSLQGPDLHNILRQPYDHLMIMPK